MYKLTFRIKFEPCQIFGCKMSQFGFIQFDAHIYRFKCNWLILRANRMNLSVNQYNFISNDGDAMI